MIGNISIQQRNISNMHLSNIDDGVANLDDSVQKVNTSVKDMNNDMNKGFDKVADCLTDAKSSINKGNKINTVRY